MKIPTRFLILAAALALLGTAISLRADVAVAPLRTCDGERCRCESCGAEHCCVVPDTKTTKHWVYTTKVVPYCRTKCPNPLKCRHKSCDTCPQCESCVRYKRVLVKREVVTTKSGYKCVPACEACRNRGASPAPKSKSPAAKAGVAQLGEPMSLPAPPAPEPAESGM